MCWDSSSITGLHFRERQIITAHDVHENVGGFD